MVCSRQLVIILLIFAAFGPPTESAPNVEPMVRQRLKPVDSSMIATRLGGTGSHRRKRPLQKADTAERDPNKSYVIKHANGSMSYVFPENVKQVSYRDSTQHETIEPRSGHKVSGDIYFPTDISPPEPTREQCGPDYPICTNVADYPQQLVNAIVARHEHRFAEVFGNDVVVDSGDKLDKRFDTSDDEFLCMSREKLIHPQSGYTMDKRLVMIVNTPNYTQGVRIETCANGGSSCDKLDNVLSFYRTECKQLYHYRTLLAIDTVTNQPYKESFRVPSCCKCVIKPLQRGSRYRN